MYQKCPTVIGVVNTVTFETAMCDVEQNFVYMCQNKWGYEANNVIKRNPPSPTQTGGFGNEGQAQSK